MRLWAISITRHRRGRASPQTWPLCSGKSKRITFIRVTRRWVSRYKSCLPRSARVGQLYSHKFHINHGYRIDRLCLHPVIGARTWHLIPGLCTHAGLTGVRLPVLEGRFQSAKMCVTSRLGFVGIRLLPSLARAVPCWTGSPDAAADGATR